MAEGPERTRRPRTLRSIFERAFAEGFASLAGPRSSAPKAASGTNDVDDAASSRPAWLARRRPGESLP